jgi:anti-sigma factor RsiW
MQCNDFHRNTLHYLDKSLHPDANAAYHLHLAECQACQTYLHRMEQLWSVIEHDRITDTDPFFYTRLQAKIEMQQQNEKSGWALSLKPLALAVAVVIPLIAGVWLGHSAVQKQQQTIADSAIILDMNNLLATPGYASNDAYYLVE